VVGFGVVWLRVVVGVRVGVDVAERSFEAVGDSVGRVGVVGVGRKTKGLQLRRGLSRRLVWGDSPW
jgi:hypothetical protein